MISYLQLVAGNLFVIRTLQIFRGRALLSTTTVTKTGTVFVCASSLIGFFCNNSPVLCFGLHFGGVFLCVVTLFCIERQQLLRLRGEVPLFLDRWILNLRLGSALTAARRDALLEHSEAFRTLAQPLFDTVSGPSRTPHHVLFSTQVLDELQRLHQEPHAAIERLENLRHLLRKSTEFRRKSGQAVRQTRIQSAVMLCLLIALSVFTLTRYRWRECADLVALSAVLSLLGLAVMHLLARKSTWKI